jgi:hypothetical protein
LFIDVGRHGQIAFFFVEGLAASTFELVNPKLN